MRIEAKLELSKELKTTEILNRLKNLKGFIKVGIPYGLHSYNKIGEKLDVALIGYIHEFGSERIPERSFLRGWLEENKTNIKKFKLGLLKKIIKDPKLNTRKVLGILGEFSKAGIINRIRRGIMPPLSPFTIEKKGSSIPLIDTGQLIRSIDYQIHEDGD